MQFRDLKSQYQALKPKMDEAIQAVLDSSDYIAGDQVEDLEKELAEYLGVKNCVSCGNGTDALVLALKAWGIGAGDAVFVPDHTFFSSAESVAFVGATPVFADVYENSFTMDVESLERVIEAVIKEGKLKPRAMVVVDLFGLPADYDRIDQMDELEIDGLRDQIAERRVLVMDKTKGFSFEAVLDLSDSELEVILCGGQLRYLKEELKKMGVIQ